MKISYNWLKQLIDTDLSSQKIDEILINTGLEVETIQDFESIKGGLKGVIVGEVIECQKHPNADRLKITKVNIGNATPLQIICGASNISKGQKVPVATIGTQLYDKKNNKFWKIKKGKIRNEVSEGMICSEYELALSENHKGIMVLENNHIAGTLCADILNVEKDKIFEIGITPNRADAMSHWGVARDICAKLNYEGQPVNIKLPNVSNFETQNNTKGVEIEIKDVKKAPKYFGITITNIKVAPSPSWIKNRLNAIGITPKNNVVDITNYVLYELGQPLHAFDANKIKKKIQVQTLDKGTKLQTLDGEIRVLHPDDLMICDGDKPLCLAGILGGLESGVTKDTTDIFLESAYFDPVSIRNAAKRHGLNTDASFRFERGIDPTITEFALKRAALLIQELTGGKIIGAVKKNDTIANIPNASFKVYYQNIEKIIGQKITNNTIQKILKSLNIEVKTLKEDSFEVIVPKYRVDVNREADIIEEILRIYGYDNIKISNSFQLSFFKYNKEIENKIYNKVANQLVNLGFYETINNSLTSPKYKKLSKSFEKITPVTLYNPLGKEFSELRISLLFSALEVISYNLNRQQKNIKIFEIGKVYEKDKNAYKETKKLSIAMAGMQFEDTWNAPNIKSDFFTMKGVINSILNILKIENIKEKTNHHQWLEQGLTLVANEKEIASYGVIDKKITQFFSIDEPILFAQLEWKNILKYTYKKPVFFEKPSRFPISKRDFSLLIDENISFQKIKEIAFQIDNKILTNINLFDVYKGKNLPHQKKSYGISFYFLDKNKTLTDKYIDKVMEKLKKAFETQLKAELR